MEEMADFIKSVAGEDPAAVKRDVEALKADHQTIVIVSTRRTTGYLSRLER